MTSPSNPVARPAVIDRGELPLVCDESAVCQAAVSSALASVFRGKFCDAILPNRKATNFKKGEIIYDVGDKNRTFFFLQRGFVKLGTITPSGNEIIYDVRKDGDVVGELCAYESPRSDRAATLEDTDAIPVPYNEVMEVLQKRPDLLTRLIEVFCRALSESYQQVITLAVDDTVHRLVKVLLRLAAKIGRPSGTRVELSTYLSQEELSQMVAARRERTSTALNFLRRRGMVHYENHGYLTLDVKALESYSS